MSTKTLRKRIALATVAALGAGVLSLVTIPAANAANSLVAATVISGGNNNVAPSTGATNPTEVAHVLNIASKLTTDGTTGTLTASGTARSIGLLSVGDISGTKIPGTTATATLLSSGKLVVYTTGAAATADMITVTGGTISANANAEAFKSDATAAAHDGLGIFTAVITPNTGSTSMIVRLYATDDAAAAASTILDGTYSGTLTGQINVTVAATNASGVLAASKSGLFLADDATGSLTSDSTSVGVGTKDWNTQQFANVRTRDAYSVSVGAGGLLQASATNGALVKIIAAGATGTPTASSDYLSTATDPDNKIVVIAAPSSAPVSTTVTVSWNGTVVGTKSYKFTGEVAKIELSSPVIGKTSNTTGNTATYKLYDSAGNQLFFTNLNVASSNTPVANLTATSALLNSIVSNVQNSTTAATSAAGAVTNGKVKFTCGIAGKTSIGVTYTNNSGTTVKSNELPVSCAGAANTYTATLDKSTYAPGDIASVTFTFKDSAGNLANDIDTISGAGANKISFDGSQLTTAVTGWTAANDGTDVTDAGVFVLKFIVGSTTGSYTGIASAGLLNSAATPQSAITLSYKVADGATSLNDVLKGIVALIASINKQIAALAKLVTKKK